MEPSLRDGKRPKVYIAGPMTGKPHHNFPAFDAAKQQLEALGYDVVSPADIDRRFGLTGDEYQGQLPPGIYQQIMLVELYEILSCDFIVLIEGWEESKGADVELRWSRIWKIPAVLLKNVAASDATTLHQLSASGVSPKGY